MLNQHPGHDASGTRWAIDTTPRYAAGMFELEIHADFAAAHAIMIQGEREPLHGHNWHVQAIVAVASLDSDGLVMDFHALQDSLHAIIEPLHNANLNETPPFDVVNPTAEHVARHIGGDLAMRLPGHVRLLSLAVTEAPRCVARYVP